MHVRDMTAADLPAVRAIFNHAVEHTTAIWTETPRTEAEQRAWFDEKTAASWPALVAEEGGDVLGFAALGPFRPQPGFRHTAEQAVYVAPEARRRGAGRALVTALLDRAAARGTHVVIAAVTADNAASLALHESLGFEEVGLFRQVGRKWGRWLDAVFLQKGVGG